MLGTKTKNVVLSFITTVALSSGFAQNNMKMSDENKGTNYRKCDVCQPAEVCECPCEEISEMPLRCAYNAPVNTLIKCPVDFFITGSFIYWQAKEKGLELGITESCENCDTGRVINMDFDFKPGFKVGLGWHSDYDDWHFYIEYTRLHLTDHKSYKIKQDECDTNECPPCDFIHPAWTTFPQENPLLQVYYQQAKGKWTMNLDIIDLELGRAYWVGTQLTYAPFVGLRGGWLDQKLNASYCGIDRIFILEQYICEDDCSSYKSSNKSDSWFIGPRVGIDTNWLLGDGFRFFGNTAVALFYQKFTTKVKEYSVEDGGCNPCECEIACACPCEDCGNINTNDKTGYITPNAEVALGFGYGRHLDCYKWYIDLAIAYEFHVFWNQNMMRNLWDKSYHPIQDTDAGDLFLQGLTITAKLDF